MSMTRNEHDERFEVSEVSRRGAHRPRGNPMTSLLPILGIAALVVGVAALGYLLFGRGGGAESATPVVASSVGASPVAPSAGSPAPSVSASVDAAGAPTPSVSPEASTGTGAAGTVDKTLVLDFYNGSSPTVPGLSRTAAAKVKAGGWQIGKIEPWNGGTVTRTTVYYADPAQLATARAVVRELGVGVAKINTKYAGAGLAVVISNDYTSS